jgi:hypothetical protein
VNPLFRALISYALHAMPNPDTNGFAKFIITLIEDSRAAYADEGWDAETPDWFEDLHAHQINEVGEDQYDELQEGYRELFRDNTMEALLPMAIHCRSEILIANAPSLSCRLKDMHATFHLLWEDGLRAEYNCRPFSDSNLDLTVPLVTRLAQIFADQFGEVVLSPGLDAFHDQVATHFDVVKFDELVAVMFEYVNALPAERREPYNQVIEKVRYHLDKKHEMYSPTAAKLLQQGARDPDVLEWSDSPDSGGFD